MTDIALRECRYYLSKLTVVGQRVTLSRYLISNVKVNWLVGQSKIDRILEGIIGSNYNLRHWTDCMTGDVTFEKMKEDNRRWNADYDRAHLYQKSPDGSLVYCEAED